MNGFMRVSLVATGIEAEGMAANPVGRPALTAIAGGQAQRVAAPAPMAATVVAAKTQGQHALALDTQAVVQEEARLQEVVDNPAPEPVAVAPQPVAQPAPQPAMVQPAPAPAPRAFSFLGRTETRPEAEKAPADSFIPEAPVAAPRKPAVQPQQADPMGSAALANNGAREARKPSLFERMTGHGRHRETARQEPEIQQATAPRPAPAAPQPAPRPAPQPAPQAEARMEVQAVEDDVLDIPAFLRRQAN
jgi:cell division protein FtsZ